MKKYTIVAATVILTICLQQESSAGISWKQAALDTELSKASYAIGLNVGASLSGMLGKDIDRAAFIEAVNAQLDGTNKRLTAEEAEKAKLVFFQKRAANLAQENKAEGEKFLAKNAKKKGVKVTKSGLQYEIIKKGNGAKPVATDTVKVHYRGTLLDGTEFDSSYKHGGQPVTFPLNRVIKAWTEGVQLMAVGSKFKFYIPSDLAYGERGFDRAIAPNSTLIFEVELLAIEDLSAVKNKKTATR